MLVQINLHTSCQSMSILIVCSFESVSKGLGGGGEDIAGAARGVSRGSQRVGASVWR